MSGWGNPLPCFVVLSVRKGSEKEQCCSLHSHPTFCHFPHFPQVDCALSGADSRYMGFCMCLNPLGLSKELSCESFSHHHIPHQFITARGFESFVSHAETLGFPVCFPLCSSWFICLQMWNCPCGSPPCCVLSAQAACLCLSTSLDDCFFNSLVVGFPCK